MRQVPLIIGDGRVARHMCHYFDLIKLDYITWSRAKNTFNNLESLVSQSTSILLLISDNNIINFINNNPIVKNKPIIHFSASLITPLAQSAHPLMSFTHDLYTLEIYQFIPFIISTDSKFKEYFRNLKNPVYILEDHLRPYYHSLCVLSGNFTAILWEKFYRECKETLKLPHDIFYPYLKQITNNILNNPTQALTGPLSRNDTQTIENNLQALKSDPFENIYKSFVDLFEREKSL